MPATLDKPTSVLNRTHAAGPSKDALWAFAKDVATYTPAEVYGTALHTVFGGRTGFAYDADVAQGLLVGDVKHRIANCLFEPDIWALFDKEQQRQIMRARCLYDLFWFATAILGYNKERPGGGVELDPELHGELCDELVYRKVPWFIAMMFRGSLKSTLVSISDSIRRYLLKPHTKRLIVSDTRPIGVGILAEIKAHIETNEALQYLWPDRFNPALIKRQKWAEDAITLPGNRDRRVGTFQVAGIDGNITGVHVPEIVLDDVVTRANTATPEQRTKVLDQIKLLVSILDPDGRFWVAGTRYHYEDAYNWMFDNAKAEPSDHYIHTRPIYRDDCSSAWPNRFSLKKIRTIKVTQGAFIFGCQYLLEPVPEDSEFRRDWIEDPMWADGELPDDLVDIVTTCDPAFSDKETRNADFWCVMTTGVQRNGHIWVIDYDMVKSNVNDFVAAIFDHYMHHQPSVIGIEAQAGQKGVVQMIEKAFGDRRLVARFQYITRNRMNKELRIRTRLQNYFSKKMVHLRNDMDQLALQLRRFPGFKDDGLDCLADAVELLRPRRRAGNQQSFTPDPPMNSVVGR